MTTYNVRKRCSTLIYVHHVDKTPHARTAVQTAALAVSNLHKQH